MCVRIQSSIISILLNLFDGYHGLILSSCSLLDLMIHTFKESFVRSSFVDTLQYAFDVRCILLNVEAIVPEPERVSLIVPNGIVNLYSSHIEQAPDKAKHVYIKMKQKSAGSAQYRTRRHLLSRSHQHIQAPEADECVNEPIVRQLTPEERSYDWSVFVVHVLQLLEGVLYFNNQLEGGYDISVRWMQDFKRPLLFSYSLYSYINQSKAKSRESDSICSMVRDLLEQYCRGNWN